jgi:hypothetical protein
MERNQDMDHVSECSCEVYIPKTPSLDHVGKLAIPLLHISGDFVSFISIHFLDEFDAFLKLYLLGERRSPRVAACCSCFSLPSRRF